ncbi:hypothetical protein G7054_g9119 [Neopestalotiopsis clavispora]|nr:hypothetical protein G7054_g9119 [Neopestalotiopsis clavispora]
MAGPNKHPSVCYQPLKALFQLTYVATILARVPLWLLIASIRRLRPHPQWTAKQALLARVAYAVTDMKSRIGVTEKLSLEAGEEGNRFQIIETSPPNFYQGPLKSPKVKPAPVGGTWFPQTPSEGSSTPKTVIYYLHGGAFIEGDGRSKYCGFPTKTMLEQGGADAVFSLQYRLSGYSEVNPFPAALQDALTGYLYLLNKVGVPSSNIVLCGDSAGANLAIALLRYLSDSGAQLEIPSPRCVTLLSPWVAPLNYVTEGNPMRETDFVPTSFLRWGAETYTAGLTNPASDAYITPLGNPFAVSVPVFVNVGTAEIFFDDIKKWVEEMKQVEGNVIELHQEDAALHDTFLVAELLGFEDSARKVISATGDFISRL